MKASIIFRLATLAMLMIQAVGGPSMAAEYIAREGGPDSFGTILLSTGAAKDCSPLATELTVYPQAQPYGHAGFVASLDVDRAAVRSDFDDHKGFVHAVKLPPGNYYLAERVADPSLKPVKIMGASIQLQSGEALYLGEFYLDQGCAFKTHYLVRDREDRDLPLLLEKNPDLRQEKVRKQMMIFSDYVVGGATRGTKSR
jgi:hypothetical protein